jgi:hypothetical protein
MAGFDPPDETHRNERGDASLFLNHGGKPMTDAEKRAADARLLSLDFIGEAGEMIATLGAAVCAAAGSGNIELTELALRQCRGALLEAIAEFKSVSSGEGHQ